MAERDLRVGQIATALDHDPAVISKAINHGQFPRVVAKIKKYLNSKEAAGA
ncbi:MAG: hypothetical protein K0R17_2262 [Rariglobus sp.]|jgi:hypothetical protein|nr:hypothetical protein [Rariglobus sp.]